MSFLFLVKRMVEVGKEILQKNEVTDLNDVRLAAFSVSQCNVFIICLWCCKLPCCVEYLTLFCLQVWFPLASILFCHTLAPSRPGPCQSNGLHVPPLLQTQLLLVYHSKLFILKSTSVINVKIIKCIFLLSSKFMQNC